MPIGISDWLPIIGNNGGKVQCGQLTLDETPTRETRPDHNTAWCCLIEVYSIVYKEGRSSRVLVPLLTITLTHLPLRQL